MDDYLTKPLNPQALIAALHKHLPDQVPTPVPAAAPAAPSAPANAETGPSPAPVAPPGVSTSMLDLDDLRNRCRGRDDLMRTILLKFHSLLRGYVADCREPAMHSDLPTAAKAAHTLKGAAANIGAKDLAAASLAVELAAKSGDAEDVTLALAKLDKCTTELLAAIDTVVPTIPMPPPESSAPEAQA
jgi:two-component system sensor histidine kinase/response regulator